MPNAATRAAPSSRGPLLWVGLALMCFGPALTVFLFFLFIMGAPTFLLGLVLVLLSGQALWRKALAIAFPVVGWLGIAAGAWALAPREQAATFLVPEGVEGTIMMVKNEPCGPPPEYENGRRLYRVPANGLLITPATVPNRAHPYCDWPNSGYFQRPDNNYFLVDRQGHRLRELTEVQATTDSGSSPEPTLLLLGRVGRDECVSIPAHYHPKPPEPAGAERRAVSHATPGRQPAAPRGRWKSALALPGEVQPKDSTAK